MIKPIFKPTLRAPERAGFTAGHANAYQKLLDLAAHASAIVGIQRGLQGMCEGTGEDAEDAFASLERELGLSGSRCSVPSPDRG